MCGHYHRFDEGPRPLLGQRQRRRHRGAADDDATLEHVTSTLLLLGIGALGVALGFSLYELRFFIARHRRSSTVASRQTAVVFIRLPRPRVNPTSPVVGAFHASAR
jgi:hypothetical protein